MSQDSYKYEVDGQKAGELTFDVNQYKLAAN